ncbi:MAG: ABC transporter substrate-binding protein [Dehalococcoidia bacterium]|nr:ABC transporter substrate-binding protein [Dehalococcoidia bacterium]
MSPRSLSRISLLVFVLALAAVLAFAACKDDKKEGTTPTAGQIDISDVPELQDGKLLIGSDIAYAPIEYYEEGTQNETGMDVDLARAMAELLGVDVEFQQVADFAGIVGDLKSKRYDIVMSAISVTPEREAEIDMVPYFGPVGTGILTPKGNPNGFQALEDLCGKNVAAQVGTYQVDQVTALNEDACKDNPIVLRTFPENPASVQELLLGRVDAQLADDPVVAYNALNSDGDLEVAADGFEAAPYGMGVRKDSPELQAVLEEALAKIRANGTYDQILEDWGQQEYALQ